MVGRVIHDTSQHKLIVVFVFRFQKERTATN